MNRVLAAMVIVLTFGLVGCGPVAPGVSLTKDVNGGSALVITSSPGGNIDAFDRAFRQWSQIPGVRVEIRHWCASACTQVLGYFTPAQICLASGARLGFHSAIQKDFSFKTDVGGRSAGLGLPRVDPIATLLVFSLYPEWIQERLTTLGFMATSAGNPSFLMNANEFWHHGYGVCSANSTPDLTKRSESTL